MSNILNKSSHPVHVNRIPIRIWGLRDEIELAVLDRMKLCEAESRELDIEDLQKFYAKIPSAQTNDSEDSDDEEENEVVMLNASNDKEDKSNEDEPEKAEKDSEEAEAAKLAEMMLSEKKEDDTTEKETTQIKPQLLKRTVPHKDKIATGFAFLSDMDMSKILCFSKKGFTLGQNICIEFLIPNGFIMTGEVIGSNHVGRNSKIISEVKPDFRIMSAFSFHFEGEREKLRSFLQSVEPDIPPPPKKLKKSADDEDDDEFEDLGF
jgi:hypothetical protein